MRRPIRLIGSLAGALCLLRVARAQLDTGTLLGTAEDRYGNAVPVALQIEGPAGSFLALRSDARGRFIVSLPDGVYTVRADSLRAACRVRMRPLETTRCDLRFGETRIASPAGAPSGAAYNAAQRLLFDAPGVVVYPLDFAGLGAIRLPLISVGGGAWTATGFRLNGLDAADSYQPGRPVLLDDAAAEGSIAVASGVSIFLRGAESSWHGGLATDETGSALAAENLPAPPDRGIVRKPDEFRWFTRDTIDLSGPLARWADLSAAATGQWASQTAPQWASGAPIGSRILLGNIRGRVRLGPRDRMDALYSGSRLDLSSGGWPAGIEAVLASPLMPSFYGVEGFENLRETDHFDLVQAGWTHQFGPGVLELRYGYSTAHLDSLPVTRSLTPVRIDLLDPAPADAPVSNFAVRTRSGIGAAYQKGGARLGLGLEKSSPRDRFQAPLGTDLISAGGLPAFSVRLNVPAGTRSHIDSFDAYAGDEFRLARAIALDVAVRLDASLGAVVGGTRAISWTSASPRAGIAITVPGFSRLVLRGSYSRWYAPLAGRYLDFAGPRALSGLVYDAATGALLERFGGACSGIAAGLKRPYSGQFDLSANLTLPRNSAFALDLLRRDDKDRLAAVNIGVPASAYLPVVIRDPGPDFIPRTFDDRNLVVYAQDPATLGRDEYLLANPEGLRELGEAITATAGTRHRYADIRASFTAEKSFGPTNPGNSAWSNDPGVVGALYANPNTLINAAGHPYMDRAFIGKFQAVLTPPPSWGGLRFVSTVNYLDGLPFARQLLVAGLPQGPFFVNATLRGSPEGGNRAEYVLNWNLRIEREFGLPFGRLDLVADLLNVLNNGSKIVESDLSGPLFNRRPAMAIAPPRILRLGLRWRF